MVVERVSLRPLLTKLIDDSFLTRHFGGRVMVYEVPLPLPPGAVLPGPALTAMGRYWEFAIAEVHDAKTGPCRFGQRSQVYRMQYVAVAGSGLPTLDLERELEKVREIAGIACA